MCAMPHSYAWRESFRCGQGRASVILACGTAHLYVCPDSLIRATWIVRMLTRQSKSHSCVWHNVFMCVPWLIHTCGMIRSDVEKAEQESKQEAFTSEIARLSAVSEARRCMLSVWVSSHQNQLCGMKKSHVPCEQVSEIARLSAVSDAHRCVLNVWVTSRRNGSCLIRKSHFTYEQVDEIDFVDLLMCDMMKHDPFWRHFHKKGSHASVCVCVCVRVCMYIFVCVCMCVCVYACVFSSLCAVSFSRLLFLLLHEKYANICLCYCECFCLCHCMWVCVWGGYGQ